MELIKVYRVQKTKRIALPTEVFDDFGWKTGDKILVYLDRKNKCLVLKNARDTESKP